MAEKLITPNLIPQVGPTGGGDGKTDSETYPVSESISDRWFIPDSDWKKDEKWAIAISAKEAWKSKLKSDVKSIIETKRDYTRIYFITNQTPSSKKKKDAQDQFIKEFGIDIVILDGVWILENVYENDLISLVVDTLNLSKIYRQEEKTIGSNDMRREKDLAEIEKNISNPNRYFEYDFQLVEDALESAILTRELEKPRDELEGKFDRVERLLNKTGNKNQLVRFRYQKAWTYVNYYDDYDAFLKEFNEFKKHIEGNITISSIENYSTLYTLLRTVHFFDKEVISTKLFKTEKKNVSDFLQKIFNRKPISSTSLSASMFKDILELFELVDKPKKSKSLLINLKKNLIASDGRLEFPFEQFEKMIVILGDAYADSNEFDDLFEVLTKLSENRNSELQAGQLYINRGGQKMAKKKYRSGLIYFGKAITKLSKSESQYGFYLASMGLSEAYYYLGLYNASYSSKISAISILLKPWFDEGVLDKRLIKLLDNLLGEEVLLGRLPHFLTWHELFRVIYYQLENQDKAKGIDSLTKFDSYLCIRLLNHDNHENALQYLPAICKKEDLLLSGDVALFLLGYSAKIFQDYVGIDVKSEEDLENYFKVVADQPLNQQFIKKLEYFNNETSELTSNILGCEIVISFSTDSSSIMVAETVLAYIEALLGTSLENLYPNSEKVTIELVHSSNKFKIETTTKSYKYNLHWDNEFNPAKDYNEIWKCMIELFSLLLTNNYVVDNHKTYLKDLFENQEVTERLSVILNHKVFLTNVLGEKPKLTLKDWTTEKTTNIRKTKFIPKKQSPPKKKSTPKSKGRISDLNKVPHNKRKVISVIENKLWNNAGWKGMGVFGERSGVGLVLGFENIEFGNKIIEDWIERFGKTDSDNRIKISIITDIDDNNPHWYQVLFSSNFKKIDMDEESVLIAPCRFHLMNASTNRNLLILKEGLKRFNKFKLHPGQINKDMSMEVNFDLYIEKVDIFFVRKDQVKENDIEYAAILNSNK